MRSRHDTDDRIAEVTQRRLEALLAELGDGSTPSTASFTGADRPDVEPSQERDYYRRTADQAGDQDEDRTVPVMQPARTAAPAVGDRRAAAHAEPARRSGGWLQDRLPPGFPGLRLGGAQLALVLVVVAVGLAAAGWWFARSAGGAPDAAGDLVPPRPSGGASVEADGPLEGTGAPSSTPVTPPEAPATLTSGDQTSVPGAGTSAGTSPGAATSAPSAEVVVDVAGKVRTPGIAVLPAGSRVVDALQASGGARKGVDLTGLNLARILVDGEQVLVGIRPAPGIAAGAVTSPPAAGASATTTALVNLNTADEAALDTLPGVGPVTAAAILEWRSENGPFASVEELLEVSGIGEATLADIAPHVTV